MQKNLTILREVWQRTGKESVNALAWACITFAKQVNEQDHLKYCSGVLLAIGKFGPCHIIDRGSYRLIA